MFSMGSSVVLVLGATDHKGTHYPPVVDMLIEMLYSYVRDCIQKHISGVALYLTGWFVISHSPSYRQLFQI